MNLSKKLFDGKKQHSEKFQDEWIAVYFTLSGSEYGTQEEREAVHRFTDQLNRAINESGEGVFDGDEFGDGQGGLFMYGRDADRLFHVVEPLLRSWPPLRKGGYAIKRYGAPHDQQERIDF